MFQSTSPFSSPRPYARLAALLSPLLLSAGACSVETEAPSPHRDPLAAVDEVLIEVDDDPVMRDTLIPYCPFCAKELCAYDGACCTVPETVGELDEDEVDTEDLSNVPDPEVIAECAIARLELCSDTCLQHSLAETLVAHLELHQDISIYFEGLSIGDRLEQLDIGGPYTVLVPNDEAFHALPGELLDALLSSPELAHDVLGAHIIEGSYTFDQLREVESLEPLFGTDPMPDIPGPVLVDITAANGRVHVIDRVLWPEL